MDMKLMTNDEPTGEVDDFPPPMLVDTVDSETVLDYSDDDEGLDGNATEVDDGLNSEEEASRQHQIESILLGLRKDDSISKVSSSAPPSKWSSSNL